MLPTLAVQALVGEAEALGCGAEARQAVAAFEAAAGSAAAVLQAAAAGVAQPPSWAVEGSKTRETLHHLKRVLLRPSMLESLWVAAQRKHMLGSLASAGGSAGEYTRALEVAQGYTHLQGAVAEAAVAFAARVESAEAALWRAVEGAAASGRPRVPCVLLAGPSWCSRANKQHCVKGPALARHPCLCVPCSGAAPITSAGRPLGEFKAAAAAASALGVDADSLRRAEKRVAARNHATVQRLVAATEAAPFSAEEYQARAWYGCPLLPAAASATRRGRAWLAARCAHSLPVVLPPLGGSKSNPLPAKSSFV